MLAQAIEVALKVSLAVSVGSKLTVLLPMAWGKEMLFIISISVIHLCNFHYEFVILSHGFKCFT